MNSSKILIYCFLISIITCTFASGAESLPESDHPYANNFDYTWPAITEPGASQIRLHFTKLELASDLSHMNDDLILLDGDGNELARYSYSDSKEDFWTEWFTGDTIKVKLQTDGGATGYGFKIDDVSTRNNMSPSSTLPESDHPYANNFDYTWPAIIEPGASQIRLHFTKLELASDLSHMNDDLILLDGDGNELARYSYSDSKEDFWTEWFTGDTIKVKLQTDGGATGYGFKIDNVSTRSESAYTPTKTSSISSETVQEQTDPELSMSDTTTIIISPDSQYEFGQQIKLTAKIEPTPQGTKTPSGTVTFWDGTTSIGTGDISSGQATLTISSLSVGSHSIVAKYSGDKNFKSSTSSALKLNVITQSSPEPQITPEIQTTPESHISSESSSESPSTQSSLSTIVYGIIATVVGGIVIVHYTGFIEKLRRSK